MNDKSVFQQKLKDTLHTDPAKDVVEDIVGLHLFKNAEKNEALLVLVELYDLLGLEKFADVLAVIDGATVSFPEKDDFKDTIQLAICYYYKYIKNKQWSEIKAILHDDDLPTVKYGIRMQQLQTFLKQIAERKASREGRLHG